MCAQRNKINVYQDQMSTSGCLLCGSEETKYESRLNQFYDNEANFKSKPDPKEPISLTDVKISL